MCQKKLHMMGNNDQRIIILLKHVEMSKQNKNPYVFTWIIPDPKTNHPPYIYADKHKQRKTHGILLCIKYVIQSTINIPSQ